MSVFSNPASGAKGAANQYIDAVLKQLGNRDPMEVLKELPEFLESVVVGLSERQIRTPEAAGKWSVVEVLQHLADSEMVWCWRLRMIVAHDRPQITGYDQDLWAKRLNYAKADPEEALAQIRILRKANLRLLDSLNAEDLKRFGVHVERGEESVEHMIRLYAGHDLVHRNQTSRIKAGL